MKKKILLYNQTLEYEEKNSERAKRLRIAVYYNQNLVVTVPKGIPQTTIEKYIIKKSKWILSKIDFFAAFPLSRSLILKHDDYEKYKIIASEIAHSRVEHFNKLYKYKYKTITIKNYKTRWGSCSKKGNLSFNFRITHLPASIRDYIFVHELCHLKEFNHSRKFWSLVDKGIPEYKDRIKELKLKGLNLY
jgi:hypothetical protein